MTDAISHLGRVDRVGPVDREVPRVVALRAAYTLAGVYLRERTVDRLVRVVLRRVARGVIVPDDLTVPAFRMVRTRILARPTTPDSGRPVMPDLGFGP